MFLEISEEPDSDVDAQNSLLVRPNFRTFLQLDRFTCRKMSVLVSNWAKGAQALPANYVFPPEKRTGDAEVPISNTIPVIDLALDRAQLLEQIIKAAQNCGQFQVVNHGVQKKLMDETMSLYKEFFDMPAEDKAEYYSEDESKSCRLYTGGRNYSKDDLNFWKDTLVHLCHPLDEHIQSWPNRPARYRDVVGEYSVEMGKLSLKILDLICEGLGIEIGYFGGELSKSQALVINHYPRCPDPSLAVGLPGHCDPNLITILQQEVYGLQTFKDGQWFGVEPLPRAFVVNIANQLEIISNGRLKSANHRAVTNSEVARTSVVFFTSPSPECVVEPAKALVSLTNQPLFKAFEYKEFLETYLGKRPKNGGESGRSLTALESYKLQI